MNQGRFRVLHVCTGNICRSPMAETIMRAELERRFGPAAREVELGGAGTYGGHAGEPVHAPVARVLGELGYSADGYAATWLRPQLVDAADLVLTATADHRGEVLRLEPRALRRTFALKELARLVADVPAADLPGDGPAERLRALVALAQDLRANDRAHVRGADDVEDPYDGPQDLVHDVAEEIRAAVLDILRPL